MTKNVCLIDWTFCVIHTFCAIQSWWRFRRPGEDFPDPWWEHEDVIHTFRKRCGDMLQEFQKKYTPELYYVCQDCPREQIWRLRLDPSYKSNRSQTNIAKQGNHVWGRVFEEAASVLKTSGLPHRILRAAEAEADDCIAVVCSNLSQSSDSLTTQSIQVVTGDSDLYQLESLPGVTVWDRKGARWRDRLKGVDPESYIAAKCFAGDSTDGIPSVGSRIGLKTALGWVNGTKAWPKDPTRINRERLELNRKLILFSNIPGDISQTIQQQMLDSQS